MSKTFGTLIAEEPPSWKGNGRSTFGTETRRRSTHNKLSNPLRDISMRNMSVYEEPEPSTTPNLRNFSPLVKQTAKQCSSVNISSLLGSDPSPPPTQKIILNSFSKNNASTPYESTIIKNIKNSQNRKNVGDANVSKSSEGNFQNFGFNSTNVKYISDSVVPNAIESLGNIQQAALLVNTQVNTFHPYGNLGPDRRLHFSENTVDEILHLVPQRDDLNLSTNELERLRKIRATAGMISGDGEFSADTFFMDSIKQKSLEKRVSRSTINKLFRPLTIDISQELLRLNTNNLNFELGLHPTVEPAIEEVEETKRWLKDVQSSAKDFVYQCIQNKNNDGITGLSAYVNAEPLKLLKELPDAPLLFLSPDAIGQDPAFFVNLIETAWLPLIGDRIANATSFLGESSLINCSEGLQQQIYLSNQIPHFARTSHFLFSALTTCRIPGIIRLLLRLNAPLFFETRINISGHIGTGGISLPFAILKISTLCDALRYNIEGLRTMWPFLFETPDVPLPKLVAAFLNTPLCNSILSLLFLPPPEHQQTVNLIQDFLRFLADLIVSVHNPFLIEQIISAPFALKKSQKLQKKKKSSSPREKELLSSISVFEKLYSYVGNEEYNIYILNECVTMIADILYLVASHKLSLQQNIIETIVYRLTVQIDSCIKQRESILHEEIWETVQTKTENLNKQFQLLLEDKEIDTVELFELTTCFQFYTRSAVWPFSIRKLPMFENPEDSDEPLTWKIGSNAGASLLSSLLSPRVEQTRNKLQAGGLGYQIPCWRSGCSSVLREWEIKPENKNFQYCQRCFIASYCSKFCAVRHWNTVHKEVCGYFARPPTFVRFFSLDETLNASLPPQGKKLCEVFEKYATSTVDPWTPERPFRPIF